MSDYFVMLNHQNGQIMPLISAGSDDEIAMFETAEEANEAGNRNLLGAAFGFEVFCRGYGE
jgi:hypothetical protein